ncbi:hypothetical protein LXL04_007597 [Taraxacum kok-saghyz]
MPFRLKNALAVFQKNMDKCFKGTEKFIAVYIDDILKHLRVMLDICQEKGLILSLTKMKIAVPEIEFLGAIIGESKIKLQPHIIMKKCDFDEEKLKTKAGLRSFLGILNYARNYILKLSLLLGPLYEKTNPHGDKRMKPSDYEIIRNIKQKVQTLPDLQISPEEAYIIIETDGCMEGWGGICKWKGEKEDPRKDEKICAYASGKFKVMQSTIDAEINACINSLEKLKIYYLDKREITLRTDCQAIVSFYNKTNSNKASRVRWLKFADIITGTGLQINIEHIDGKQNVLADSLSRLVNLCFAGCTEQVQAKEVVMKSLQITEELLQDIAQSRNVKNGYEQITQISGLCHRFIMERSSSNSRDHYIDTIKSKPTQLQYQWQNLVPTPALPNNWNEPQQKKPLLHYDTSMPFWTSKPKSACPSQQKTTTGVITGPTSSDKIRKPEDSSLNLKNYVMMWAESKYDRPNQPQVHYKYHPVHSYLLDVSSDDEDDNEEAIVDLGWDDFTLHSIKRFRPDIPNARKG